ncbi:hypothetical protein [Nocardia lijiangensis]|uniref:hypothetical protein n=1 Tax=Nocardia lijiangensis TaxID=299618 RepID=UPI003D7384EB
MGGVNKHRGGYGPAALLPGNSTKQANSLTKVLDKALEPVAEPDSKSAAEPVPATGAATAGAAPAGVAEAAPMVNESSPIARVFVINWSMALPPF